MPVAKTASLLFSVALLALGSGACIPADATEVYVTSEADRDWLIRVPEAAGPAAPLVFRVKPGADGVAYYLREGEPFELELLEETCEPVGDFEPVGDVFRVDDVDGLVVALRNGTRRWNTPEIQLVGVCGGRLP
jgi:hypothetical protein